jgi:hypothetical protein
MTIDRKRRARRIAADEAHSWARNLRLGNHHGKSVLRSLTLYVDGDGLCFVGIDQLAEDCELSPDTVRRRLVWLEEIGAISRQSQWIDASGVRNGEGRGKRTSDLIKLLTEADQEEIEARARGEAIVENEAETTAISPSSQQGLNPPDETVSPAPALGQPSHCGEGLISEPEPEISPQPPSGGSVAGASLEGWKEFADDWQEPILRQSIAQAEWAKLTPSDRALAAQAARGYVAWRKAQRKPPNVLGAHLFLRERDAWPKFAAYAPEAAKPAVSGGFDPQSREGKAVIAMYAVARTRPFESRSRIVYPGEMTPQLLAFADAPQNSEWLWLEESRHIGAWTNFLGLHVKGARPPMMVTRGTGDEQRRGFYAPWLFPPSVTGKTYEASDAPDVLATDDDLDAFASESHR